MAFSKDKDGFVIPKNTNRKSYIANQREKRKGKMKSIFQELVKVYFIHHDCPPNTSTKELAVSMKANDWNSLSQQLANCKTSFINMIYSIPSYKPNRTIGLYWAENNFGKPNQYLSEICSGNRFGSVIIVTFESDGLAVNMVEKEFTYYIEKLKDLWELNYCRAPEYMYDDDSLEALFDD